MKLFVCLNNIDAMNEAMKEASGTVAMSLNENLKS